MVLVIAPDLRARGGISAVMRVLSSGGLFDARRGPHPRACVPSVDAREPKETFEVRHFASARDGSLAGKFLFSLYRLAIFAVTRLSRPSLVHVHTSTGVSFLRKSAYVWLASLKGARILLHIHPGEFWDQLESAGVLRRRAVMSALRRSDGIVVLTEVIARKARSVTTGVEISVLPNAVNLKELAIHPRPAREEALIAFLGWYVKSKGAFDLLEALVTVHIRCPEMRAVFGGWKGSSTLKNRVRTLGLADVVDIQGWLGRDEVTSLLSRCTVFVLPSYTEGVPMVILEAMGCGAPIVTCPVGGIPDVAIEGRNAVYVRPGDIQALAETLLHILNDEKARTEMSRANLMDARRYDVTVVIKELRGRYEKYLVGN
ncbi:MAG TPA: glycosyltransferase family 4 protein [Candidatus Dormibacteraeota bacterium]|nr:glycosyltransferase family 4 protein [Candidatus Dormibacteraeota bacterium]